MSPVPADLATRPAVAAPALQPAIDAGCLDPVAEPLTVGWLGSGDWPALADEWRVLARTAGPNAFLAPAFALAARRIDPAPGLGAFAMRRDGRLVGLVAGRFALGGRVFRLWSHAYAPLSETLAAAGYERAVLEALLSTLAGRGCAALEATHLAEGAFAEALDGLCEETGRAGQTLAAHRRAALTGPPPAPTKEMRRLARRLSDEAELSDLSTASGHPHGAAIAAFLALEDGGWKGRRGTAMARSEASRAFFGEALSGLLADGQARIDILTRDGQPLAAAVTLMAADRAWYWKTAYDEAFSRFSPGVLLSHRLGAALMADGRMSLVDSCAVPGHPMIDRLWPGRLGIAHRLVAVRPFGPGLAFHAAVALRRADLAGRAFAKRLLKR